MKFDKLEEDEGNEEIVGLGGGETKGNADSHEVNNLRSMKMNLTDEA